MATNNAGPVYDGPPAYAAAQPVQVIPQQQQQGQMMQVKMADGSTQYVMAVNNNNNNVPVSGTPINGAYGVSQQPQPAVQVIQPTIVSSTGNTMAPTYGGFNTNPPVQQIQVIQRPHIASTVPGNTQSHMAADATFATVPVVGNYNPNAIQSSNGLQSNGLQSNGIQSIQMGGPNGVSDAGAAETLVQNTMPTNINEEEYNRVHSERRELELKNRRCRGIAMVVIGIIVLIASGVMLFWEGFILAGVLIVWGITWIFNLCPNICGFGSNYSNAARRDRKEQEMYSKSQPGA